ncbi:hypothetical protein SLEP1_g41291 [Rubroshorea leprosula]|uniref:Uncharacterized protein n=1 Tax=Rubroshorea leprosula TaxID=152421 RepID=A0AAV5L660_9ROSI|nr:hypothetical protein SLEP1_g41291 [Rubroshorea leprosula]
MTERRPTSASNSNSTETPPPPSDKNPEKEEPKEPTRKSKRLKGCPTKLEKLGELSASNGISSFTFDTKLFDCCSPEFTPKFGSFSPVTSKPPEKDRLARKSGDEEEGTDREAEESGDEEEGTDREAEESGDEEEGTDREAEESGDEEEKKGIR